MKKKNCSCSRKVKGMTCMHLFCRDKFGIKRVKGKMCKCCIQTKWVKCAYSAGPNIVFEIQRQLLHNHEQLSPDPELKTLEKSEPELREA